MAYSTISKPSLHFNTKLYTGNGGTQALTGVGFQPDWTWIKVRDQASNHNLQDSVRGSTKIIKSNTTADETTDANGVTAFNSDGFSIGSRSDINNSGSSYCSWSWKAGTTGSGTTGGSGTGKAYSYSVNTTAGFSIVQYIGNGSAGHTIPHHLGAAPKMVMTKVTIGNTNNWGVYHHSMGNDKAMYLDGNAAETNDTFLNDTTPTSSVVTLGSNMSNQDGKTFIMYSFAEKKGYSKFGSYTGNANADGPFIFTGFKPSFIIIKNSSSAHNWTMIDNKRLGYNDKNYILFPDLNNVEPTTSETDILSNGFKIRASANGVNQAGNTIIYMAFAEEPLVANVGASIPATAR